MELDTISLRSWFSESKVLSIFSIGGVTTQADLTQGGPACSVDVAENTTDC
jgi:hypothetical protein